MMPWRAPEESGDALRSIDRLATALHTRLDQGSQQVNELEQVMAQRISMVGSSYQLVQQLCEAVSEANSPAGSSCTIAARILGQVAGHGGRAAGRGHSGSRQDVSGATLQIWLPTLSQKASFPKHLLVNYGRGSEAGAADASAAEPPFHARSRFLRCVDGDPASQGKREGDDTQGTLAEFQCAMTHIPEGPHIAQQIQAAGVVWTSPSSRHSTQEAQGAPCNLLAPSGSAGDGAKSAHEETANPARPSALAAESDVLEAMQAECDMVQRLCEEFLARSSGEAPGGDTDQQSRRPEAGSAAPGEGRSYKMPSTLLDAQIATGDAAAVLLA